jgi:hypothetical protein
MWLVSYSGYLFFQFPSQLFIITENKTKEWSTRKTIAENLAIQDDESNEMLLKIAPDLS